MDDFGLLVGRHFTALPTLANEELSELQLDSSGRLILSGRHLAATDSYAANDAGLGMLVVRNDAGGPLAGVADGEYTPLQVNAQGQLSVEAAVALSSEKDEDSAHVSGDTGSYVLAVRADTRPTDANTSADGDYASLFVNDSGELYVKDTDSAALLTTIDADTSSIATSTADIAAATHLEDSAHVSGDRGNMPLAVRNDAGTSLVDTDGDYAPLQVNATGKLLTSNPTAETSLSNIETDIGTIDTNIAALTHDEDSAHVSGDKGVMPLAVRADSDGSLVGTDGDYAPLQVNADGKLKVVADVIIAPPGTESYTVTDDLAAAGDGLATITAAATPWVTVASLSVGAGTTAYIYGWQFACDQNCQARIMTDDTADEIVYKTDMNSSATPGVREHFANDGRIEIVGAAGLELRIEMKKRSTTGGNANGTGSLHVRLV